MVGSLPRPLHVSAVSPPCSVSPACHYRYCELYILTCTVLPLANSAGGHRLGVNGLAVDPQTSTL